MEDFRHWTEILLESYKHAIDGLIIAFPKVIGGIVIFLLGWLIARLVAYLVAKSLKILRFNQIMDRVHVSEFLQRVNIQKAPSEIVGRFIFWTLMLLLVVAFADMLQLTVVSEKIGALINYIPNIFIALLILVVGLYLANTIREIVQTTFSSYAIKAGKLIGNIIFYLLAVVISLTALDQLQFNIDLLTSNVMILLAGVSLAFAIAYGLSAKEILPNLIASYYSKNMFSIGQTIRMGEVTGEIIEISNVSVIIRTESGKRVIPAKKLVTEDVELLDLNS